MAYLVPMWREDKWGFIDTESGDFVVNPQYDFVGRFQYEEDFSLYLAPVKKDGLWGFITNLNEVVIPPEYEKVRRFSFAMD